MKCSGCGNDFMADIDTGLCPECQARLDKSRGGKMNNKYDCPVCKGSGRTKRLGDSEDFEPYEVFEQCSVCHGTGKVLSESRLLTVQQVKDMFGGSIPFGSFNLLEAQDAQTHSIDLAHEQARVERIFKEVEKLGNITWQGMIDYEG